MEAVRRVVDGDTARPFPGSDGFDEPRAEAVARGRNGDWAVAFFPFEREFIAIRQWSDVPREARPVKSA